jgi:hypothetical protein
MAAPVEDLGEEDARSECAAEQRHLIPEHEVFLPREG